MYKLPDDITNVFLKGQRVIMICFNISQIYIHFESSTHIAIDGQYILSDGEISRLYDAYPISTDNGLLKLLEKTVTHIDISNSRQDLEIYFEDNISLKLIGTINYESYTIRIGERTIIV